MVPARGRGGSSSRLEGRLVGVGRGDLCGVWEMGRGLVAGCLGVRMVIFGLVVVLVVEAELGLGFVVFFNVLACLGVVSSSSSSTWKDSSSLSSSTLHLNESSSSSSSSSMAKDSSSLSSILRLLAFPFFAITTSSSSSSLSPPLFSPLCP